MQRTVVCVAPGAGTGWCSTADRRRETAANAASHAGGEKRRQVDRGKGHALWRVANCVLGLRMEHSSSQAARAIRTAGLGACRHASTGGLST